MNLRNYNEIVPDAVYSMAQVERLFGISTTTFQRWRSSGRLVVISTRPSFAKGQDLINAIENQPAKKSA